MCSGQLKTLKALKVVQDLGDWMRGKAFHFTEGRIKAVLLKMWHLKRLTRGKKETELEFKPRTV